MKKLILCSLLFLSAFFYTGICTGQQQNQFAPVGAEWYHNLYWGVFHSTVTDSLVYHGVPCRHIKTQAVIINPAQSPGVQGYDYYVYNNQDTVFVYNQLFNRFTPLYVFNVQAGDTLKLPILPPEGGDGLQLTPGSDSLFYLRIDSVKMKAWDGVPLKTVYSHPIDRDSGLSINRPYYGFSNFWSWGNLEHFGNDSIGIYVQKLGSIYTGFSPQCGNCGNIVDEGAQRLGTLRCYHEPGGISVQLVDTCNNGATGILTMSTQKNALMLYPNPAKNQLLLKWTGSAEKQVELSVYDMLGRKLLVFPQQDLSRQPVAVSIASLTAGAYFIQVKSQAGLMIEAKFVKED